MHSPSTKMGGKLKLRKASLTLVMHLKLDFSSTVTRVTLEWLFIIINVISDATDHNTRTGPPSLVSLSWHDFVVYHVYHITLQCVKK